jgi:phosphoglycerate dehydrogenase-like enzyme
VLVVLTGIVDQDFKAALARRLTVDVESGIPIGDDQFVAVVVRDDLPSGLIDDPRLQLLVLVEPVEPLHDLAIRRLAGRHQPMLDVVRQVRSRLHGERTWALIQSLAIGISHGTRRLQTEHAELSRLVDGAPVPGDDDSPMPTLAGATLGCVGFGPMAQQVAVMAAAGGMEIVYWLQSQDRRHQVDAECCAIRTGARERTFPDVLAGADVVVLDLEYGDDSIRIMDADALAVMRRSALLVNTSHGRAIDEGSLIQALRGGVVAGAALDRFNFEPLPSDSPLRDMDNVLLTPGLAIPSAGTVCDETARLVANAIQDGVPEVGSRDVRRMIRRRKPDRT